MLPHRPWAALAIAGLNILAIFAPLRTADAGEAAPVEREAILHVGATWGQMLSSQLLDENPTSYWNMHMNVPMVDGIGMSTQLRMDSIVFGESNRPTSMLVHPGRTDYSIATRILPAGAWLGMELHHVSSHAVASLHDGDEVNFEPQIDRGGASNFAALLVRRERVEFRVGVGSLWSDTNTAPIFLDIEGFLLNSRAARGPFTTLRLSTPELLGVYGHVAAMGVYDRSPYPTARATGNVLSWGAAFYRPLNERWVLGMSYLGNNGTPELKRADNTASLFLRLRWALR